MKQKSENQKAFPRFLGILVVASLIGGPVFRRSTRKLPTFTFFSSTDVSYYMPCYP